ncbi:MAG TPA: YraN family protein [Actinobacteria bacterium]|nr:YraN family protein [Actinomycetota bacterium]
MVPTPSHLLLGRWGEDLAASQLAALGWTILARQWRCPQGEADLIARDVDTGDLVVCEVKTRSSTRFGSPLEAITPQRMRRLQCVAYEWMRRFGHHGPVRIDAMAIIAPHDGSAVTVEHRRGLQ